MTTHTTAPVIPLNVHEKGLFLRTRVGEGSLGDVEFRLSSLIPTGEMAVEIGDRTYVVDVRALVEAAVAEHERLEASSGEVSA